MLQFLSHPPSSCIWKGKLRSKVYHFSSKHKPLYVPRQIFKSGKHSSESYRSAFAFPSAREQRKVKTRLTNEEKLSSLNAFSQSNGYTFNNVELYFWGEDMGIGFRATDRIKEGEVVLKMPKQLLLSVASFENHPMYPLISQLYSDAIKDDYVTNRDWTG